MLHRWTIRSLSLLEKAFENHKHAVGKNWRINETYIKDKGAWQYLYCAVDRLGKTVDILLTPGSPYDFDANVQ